MEAEEPTSQEETSLSARHASGSLTSNAFWLMCARTLAFGFSFALPLLLVRSLSQTDFGIYKQVFLVVMTAVNILPLGFHMSAFYFLPREHEQARRSLVIFNILLFHLVVAGAGSLLLALRPDLLATIFNTSELAAFAPHIAVVLWLWVGSWFFEYVAVANGEVRMATVLITGLQLTRTLLLVAAGFFFASVEAIIYASIIQGALQLGALVFYINSRFRSFWRHFNWPMMRKQAAYALPFGFASLFYFMQLNIDNYFVSHNFGAAAFAIYSIGCFQLPLYQILSDSTVAVVIPRVSYLQKEGAHHEILALIARMVRKLAAVYFAVYVFLTIMGREFIVVLFTEQYLASWPIFVINLVVIPLTIIQNAYEPIIRAYAEHRYFLLAVRMTIFTLLCAALWYGTPRYGMVGAITIGITANAVERLIIAVKAARVVGVRRRDWFLLKDVGLLAVAALTAGAATFGVRSLVADVKPFYALALCGIVFALVYLTLVMLLGIVTTDERDALRRKAVQLRSLLLWKRATAISPPV
jgi:O-antigen/teichoic acid export membrane protein